MSGRKPTHKAVLMWTEKDAKWQPIEKYHEICAMWLTDKGNLIMNIPKGMNITGKVLIKPVVEGDGPNRPIADEDDEDDIFVAPNENVDPNPLNEEGWLPI